MVGIQLCIQVLRPIVSLFNSNSIDIDIAYSVLHIKNAVNTHTINTSFFVFYMSKFGIGILVGVFGISVAAELIWTEKS